MSEATDTTRAIIGEIVKTIGPRLACSEDERRAADWMAARLRQKGFDATVHEFPSVPSFTITFSLLAITAVIGYVSKVPLIPFAASAIMAAEVCTFYILSRLLSRFWRSRNAEAFRKSSAPATQTVVLIAHIDSALEAGIKSAKTSRLLLIFMMIAPLILGSCVGQKGLLQLISALAALFLLSCAVIMAKQFIIDGPVPGAADNASGMAALTVAAGLIPTLDRTDLWLVGTGSEEAGLFGMVDFLKRRKLDRKSAWIINLDQIGRGPLSAITSGGMLIPLKAAPELVDLTREAADAAHIPITLRAFRHMSTDACPCMIRGYRAISLMGAMDHWHQRSDVLDHIDPEIAANAGVIAARMAEALDARATEPVTGEPAIHESAL